MRVRYLVAVAAVAVALLLWLGTQFLASGDPAPAPPAAATPAPPAAPPPPEVELELPIYPKVLVATRNLQSGVMLVSELVAWQEWREEVDAEAVVLEDVAPLRAILGSVTRRAFPFGTPITWDGIIVPGGPGFIGAVLQPGMRAVTIEVARATSSANVIYPGDRVDVLVVAPATDNEIAVQSIVEDVRVLAVGSTTLSPVQFSAQSNLQQEFSPDGNFATSSLPTSDNYTLEVGPRDANRLTLAATSGNITLAMRSLASSSLPDYDGYGHGVPMRWGEVMIEPELPEEDVGGPSIRVIRIRESGIESQTVVLDAPDPPDDSAPDGPDGPSAGLGAET